MILQVLAHTFQCTDAIDALRGKLGRIADPSNLSFQHAALTSRMESLAILMPSGRYIGHLPSHFTASFVERGEMR